MLGIRYSKTETHEGTDCIITKEAHIMEVTEGCSTIGFVATCSTIYRGCWGFDSGSQSFVYDREHLADAIKWCDDFIDIDKERYNI